MKEKLLFSKARASFIWLDSKGKFHYLLAGVHGTRPCGSQLPSAGGLDRLTWRRKVSPGAPQQKGARPSVAGRPDPRFRYFKKTGKDGCLVKLLPGKGQAAQSRLHR
ncbi:hypothetical protein AVEN_165102-1 [Araneus ventricosus]|uniref:Uncharacterized protein n=1 Tax=Araneus ventricosus TaxID=182803 RepID=A0A4Y2UI67_ARAVE|nr:hypothetical protein AVEN_121738-1 [Araneus ventricosus]GBO12280.1 hypothetical protein AVEN_163805-1 [Araneus ventricosus]GBO12296.1 hypothetical protein AVEN_258359-1 [Araneus ventricosus]GBO12303.1 hypothetical protein AVEN_165102-1 [Araneus ventricosus]